MSDYRLNKHWAFALVFICACQGAESSDSLYEQVMAHASQSVPHTQHNALQTLGEFEVLSTEVPNFPESVFAAGAFLAVSGPASFTIPLGEPAYLTLHDRQSGVFAGSIEVPYPGYLPPGIAPNPLSVAIPGALGDIYITQVLTGVYRVNSLFGFAEQYTTGPMPDIPPCIVDASGSCSVSAPCPEPPIPGAPACSNTMGLPPLSNSLLFDDDGTLFASDSFQASIWKISPETRSYEHWVSSAKLMGNPYSPFPAGANGLAFGPDGAIYVANTTGGPTFGGAIYRIPNIESPSDNDIELLIAFDPVQPPGAPFALPQGPDGLAFDTDGNLWLSLAFANSISKLTLQNGVVVAEERFDQTPPAGIQLNQPSELHLDSRRALGYVANHALEPPTPEDWALFSFTTGVRGQALNKPWLGWDCTVQDCNINWQTIDLQHASQLAIEELFGL